MSKNITTVNEFSGTLKRYEKSIAQLLQQKYGISPEEFYVTCVNAVKKNPKLLNCDPHSLFGAILLSAEVGLKPNTPDQHAFLIPYKGQVKFQIGYKGLIEIMYRNPRVLNINAVAVFEKDEFEYGFGLNPYLNHRPYRGKDRGKLVATYAVVKLKDAEPIFTVVEDYELAELKEFSQTKDSDYSPYNSGADVHHFMDIKASVKKISKLIPKQGINEISKAVDYDSKFEGGASVQVPLPQSDSDVVSPKLVEQKSSSLSSAFSVDFTETPEPQIIESKEESVSESTFEKEVDFASMGNDTAVQENTPEQEKESSEDSDFDSDNQGSLF